MKTLLTTFNDGDCPVMLYQTSKYKYMVVYGAQEYKGLDWQKAAEEYGYCMFHSLECAGKIE
jgi:hypothetical protein